MTQIAINELPEALQQLLLEVEQTNTPLTVTQEGKPLLIISRATPLKPRPPAGCMKGSGKILGDIVSPIEQPWEVLQ
jgi:antitoxin VapB